MAYKGKFKPINPKKYRGDPDNIIYRSRWESRFMGFLDRDPGIIEWSSEEFYIPYRCKTDNKMHRYFPDFKVKVRTKTGIKIQVIEIKPHGQTIKPQKPPKITKRYINEALTYAKNTSKWDFAREWCASRGYDFIILTEKHLNLKF